jgi:hypothetical protein
MPPPPPHSGMTVNTTDIIVHYRLPVECVVRCAEFRFTRSLTTGHWGFWRKSAKTEVKTFFSKSSILFTKVHEVHSYHDALPSEKCFNLAPSQRGLFFPFQLVSENHAYYLN